METLPGGDVRSSLEAGWQLPAYLYSDPSIFELERETIFRRGWMMVGFLSKLTDPGSYITRNIGGTPIVVTRGADGALHGFVNADPDAPPLVEYLGDALGRLTELNLDVGRRWDHAGSSTYDVEANWKLFAENALECYHCLLVHRDTFAAAIATDPENYLCEDYGNVFMQVAPIRHAHEAESRSESELQDFRLVYFWPSTALSIDEYAVVATQLVPVGPKRCRFVVDVYARPGVDGAVLDSWTQMYDTTFNEDKVVVTAQQDGYDSGLIPRGRLLPPSEPSIAAFQRRTWEALAPVLERR